MNCARVGCVNTGTVFPILKLRAHKNHEPAQAMLQDLHLCGDHAEEINADNVFKKLITDEAWGKLTIGFRLHGFAAPVKNLTQVYFGKVHGQSKQS